MARGLKGAGIWCGCVAIAAATISTENWLLIKGKDEHADEENGDVAIERYQKSVVSKRSMEDIATGAGKVWKGGKSVSKPALNPAKKKTPKPAKKTPGKKASEFSPPDFVPPQLATLVTAPPVGPNWVHEIKFDGYRLLARLEKGEVTLTTRNNNDWTAKFKELAGDVGKLPAHNAILDGEVVSMEPDGSMSFHALQNALRSVASATRCTISRSTFCFLMARTCVRSRCLSAKPR